MDIDPNLAKLGADLAGAMTRNGASYVTNKIRTSKAKKDDKATIAELEEIINDLLADKSVIQRIAQAYEQELVSQKITKNDIEYITENLLPVIDKFVPADQKSTVEQLKPLLSVETLTIMQLIGFNYKRAIGEPLTLLLQKFIESKAPGDPAANLKFNTLLLESSSSQESYERYAKVYKSITGKDIDSAPAQENSTK